jgi:hypothetical protein
VPRMSDRADAVSVLTRALDAGLTGALLGHTATGERCTAYVMSGEVLAVHADDDDIALLHRLVNAGHLGAREAAEIEREVQSGTPATSVLFDLLAEDLLATSLYERFRENLYRFLSGSGGIAFEPMDAVFVENIQVGHDTRGLLAELLALRGTLASIERDVDRVLEPGAGTVTSEEQVRLVELCANGRTLAELLAASPYEPTRTLALVAELLDAGALEGSRPPPRRSLQASPPLAPDPSPEPTGRWVVAPDEPDGFPGDIDVLSDVEMEEHTEEVDRSTFRQTPGVQPTQLLAPSAEGDDLDAFADHDYVRAGGGFVQARSNLDRVVLAEAPRRGKEEDPGDIVVVEMEDADSGEVSTGRAVSLNFSGRMLGDDDARRKIQVVNEVLATVVEALDDAKGAGVGQARLQVLVEGTAGGHAVLFAQVELAPGGRLPVERVMRNLKKRPEGERRHLLNRALADVIERALSLADEALDQRGMERMLERIAGYQQRMGM